MNQKPFNELAVHTVSKWTERALFLWSAILAFSMVAALFQGEANAALLAASALALTLVLALCARALRRIAHFKREFPGWQFRVPDKRP